MKQLSNWQALLIASQLGFVLVAGVALGLLAGSFLDSNLHTSPAFTVLGALAGMVAGIFSCVQIVRGALWNGPSE